ncbi:MAG: hypothetical protein IJO45_05275, partial [Oscillospiraceae bacterium]|nr:hypothetical protein [Oscillospiraceae bacterium]
FSNTAQKIPEMRQHSGNFIVCLEEKFLLQNCIAPQKGGDSRQTRKKAQKYWVLRAFLTPYGVDKRLFEAIYHCGAPPNGRDRFSCYVSFFG